LLILLFPFCAFILVYYFYSFYSFYLYLLFPGLLAYSTLIPRQQTKFVVQGDLDPEYVTGMNKGRKLDSQSALTLNADVFRGLFDSSARFVSYFSICIGFLVKPNLKLTFLD